MGKYSGQNVSRDFWRFCKLPIDPLQHDICHIIRCISQEIIDLLMMSSKGKPSTHTHTDGRDYSFKSLLPSKMLTQNLPLTTSKNIINIYHVLYYCMHFFGFNFVINFVYLSVWCSCVCVCVCARVSVWVDGGVQYDIVLHVQL